MMTDCFILARAVHFGACLLAFGVFTFDRFIASSIIPSASSEFVTQWQRRLRQLTFISLSLIFLSGIVWFICVAMTMSGLSLNESLRPETLGVVWHQTQFGTVWQFRLAIWFLALADVIADQLFASIRTKLRWLQLIFAAALLGSLAWAGHGQEGRPAGLHLGADFLHLVVAGFWPTGLLPLALCLRQLCRAKDPQSRIFIAALVNRFSAISLVSVALLVVTGWVNSWYLVGSFANLFHQRYGQWLMIKLILFLVTIVIGAINLLRLKPRLTTADNATLARLRTNVFIELILTTAIIIAVGILGILPPAIQ